MVSDVSLHPYTKGRGPTRRFLAEVAADWGADFDRIVPAHYDAPIAAGASELQSVRRCRLTSG